MGKYYAVVKGIKPGVYNSWPECEAQVKGFPGASYKGLHLRKTLRHIMRIILNLHQIIQKLMSNRQLVR